MMHYDVIARSVDSDPDDMWVISERAKKVTPNGFKAMAKGYTPMDIRHWIEYKTLPKAYIKPENPQKMYNDLGEFLDEILDMVVNYSMVVGDFGRLSSWGIVTRNGQDVLVLTDYGVTDDIMKEFYGR